MKFNKIYIALVVFASALFVGCNEDFVDTEVPGDPFTGAYSVAFEATNPGIWELDPNGDLTFTLTVSRDTSGTAIDVSIVEVADTANMFTVPATLSFAADAQSADLVITLADAAEIGVTYGLELEIDSQFNNPYATASPVYFGEIAKSVWGSLGTVQFYDSFTFYSVAEVQLEQNGLDLSQYRITSPYLEPILIEAEWEGWIGGKTQDKIIFTVNEDNTVSWGSYYTNLLYQGNDGQEIQAFEGVANGFEVTDPNVAIYNGDNIEYFELHPNFYINGVGGWGENAVYLGMPGFDLATALGIPVFGATK